MFFSNSIVCLYIICLLYIRMIMVIGHYTNAANDTAYVLGFPWIGLESTISFILTVSTFACHLNHDMGAVFYGARPKA